MNLFGISILQEWQLVLVAGLLVLASYLNHRRSRLQKQQQQWRLPPGPKGWPLLGNLDLLMSKARPRHQILDELAKEYGPIMSLRLGSKPAIVVSSPEVAKEILKTYDKEFASRPFFTVAHVMSYGADTIAWSPYGPHWRFIRRLVTQEVLSSQRVQQFEAFRAEETSRMIKSIFAASQSSAAPLDMNRRSTYLVLNMLTRILINKRFFDDAEEKLKADNPDLPGNEAESHEKLASEFKGLVEETFYLGSVSIIGDFVPALGFLDRIRNYKAAMRRTHERYETFTKSVVEEHRRQLQSSDDGHALEPQDVVDIMLSLPGENGAEKVEERVIRAQIMSTLNAGLDTSSSSIEWGLAELLRHPQVMRKVQEELDSVVGKDRVVVEADLPNLPYFQAVVKEVFRLHPPGPLMVPHFSTQHCRIAGFDVPEGTTAFVNVWSIGRHAQWWEDPLEFRPERFVGKDMDVRGQHFELLPFGSGRRGCPGMHLGIAVVQQTLARLVHSFTWSLPPGIAPHDLDMSERISSTLPRAAPLLAFAEPRLSRHLYE